LRRKTYLVTTLLIVSVLVMPILGLQSSSQHISSYGTVNYSPFLGKGVNYLSLYHMYSSNHTTNDILRRDFSRFQKDGINVISLSLYWYRLEGHVRGSYDGVYPDGSPYGKRFLDDVKRVISIAHEYDIKVLVTIHTLWGDNDSSWCTPDYVIDPVSGKNIGLAIVRSEDMKQAFIDMFNHTVSYLAGTEGIWAWAILNEPWYWPHVLPPPYENVNQKESFIDLIQKLSNIVKTLDGRPVTVRFVNTHTWIGADGAPRMKNIFIDDWGWDQRIFNALDFISFNAYIPKYPELHDTWRNMTAENVVGGFQRNKRVWITEFGFNSDDDAAQASYYKEMLDFYKTLPIDGWIAWFWEGDAAADYQGFGAFGKGYNLCSSTDGSPRPAYYNLLP